MLALALLQLVLPGSLIVWLALSPPRDRLTFALHAAAVLLVTAALLLTGLWTLLPWWLAWLWGAFGIAALVWAYRSPRAASWPRGLGLARAAVLCGIALIGGWFTAQGVAGRRLPSAKPVELAWPLAAGHYLVANGGSALAVNSHLETLDDSVPRHRLWRGQSYGVDLVAIGRFGRTATGWQPADPARYAIFGTAVLAPCDGTVVAAADGAEDHRVPFIPREPDPGNFVLLRCAAADVLLAHFRRGSLVVAPGSTVRTGTVVGMVGNSGSSNEPHLHIHAQTPGPETAPFAGEPLPILIDGRWLRRSERVRA